MLEQREILVRKKKRLKKRRTYSEAKEGMISSHVKYAMARAPGLGPRQHVVRRILREGHGLGNQKGSIGRDLKREELFSNG